MVLSFAGASVLRGQLTSRGPLDLSTQGDGSTQGAAPQSHIQHSAPLGPDAKLEELQEQYARADGAMKRVDSAVVRRSTWRALAELGSKSGERPLVPQAFLDARSPAALKSVEGVVFFVFQLGEYVPGPFPYDWRVIVIDDASNTVMLEQGGKGPAPAYVEQLRVME
jgi:hypothetical protein